MPERTHGEGPLGEERRLKLTGYSGRTAVEPFREGVVYYLKDGRVRGVLLWNVWGQVDAARQPISEVGPFTPQALKGRLAI